MATKRVVMFLLAAVLVAGGCAQKRMASDIRLEKDGYFRTGGGELFVPLGGFHGNMASLSMLKLSDEQRQQLDGRLWKGEYLDLVDLPDEVLAEYFKVLADHGVTALRLFPRANVSHDVLDLCGKANTRLRDQFTRVFAAARPYEIRFLLQIMPEPDRTGYLIPKTLADVVRPAFSEAELSRLSEAQKRFIIDGKNVSKREWFTDADVRACQRQYLDEILEWVAGQEQIFALEIYNEQGWTSLDLENSKGEKQRTYVFTYVWEQEEIDWTADVIRQIKRRLPRMPVCISHPGFGAVGFDPMRWMRGTGADFYSSHLYAGLCGESDQMDFAGVTAATAALVQWPNFPGEWGVLSDGVPAHLRRRSARDAIWLDLLAGAPGFMQWRHEFLEEYRPVGQVLSWLPARFTREKPTIAVDMAGVYAQLHEDTRYSGYKSGELFAAFPFNKRKQQDPAARAIFAAWRTSLDSGVPIRFAMGERGAVALETVTPDYLQQQSRPIRLEGGYQLAWMKDARSNTYVGYARGRAVRMIRGIYVAVPLESPLKLCVDLPKGEYQLRLLNLETGTLHEQRIAHNASLTISENTADDYVICLSPVK